MLAGDPPPGGQTAGPVTDTDTATLGKALTRIRDKVVIVKAGANPAAQAAAAAAVGARAVVIAAPGDAPLPAMAAGRSAVPVIGVTGDAAQPAPQGQARHRRSRSATPSAAPTLRRAADRAQISPNTSQGPTAGGLPKPDLAAAGSALTRRRGRQDRRRSAAARSPPRAWP